MSQIMVPPFDIRDMVQIIAYLCGAVAIVASTRQTVSGLAKRLDMLTSQVEKLTEKTGEFAVIGVQVGNLKERIFILTENGNEVARELAALKSRVDVLKASGTDHLGETSRDLQSLRAQVDLLKISGCDICHKFMVDSACASNQKR